MYSSDTVAEATEEADRACVTCAEGLAFLNRLGSSLRNLGRSFDLETHLGNPAGLGVAAAGRRGDKEGDGGAWLDLREVAVVKISLFVCGSEE